MASPYPYQYDAQFMTYIGQIMRVFSGFQVRMDDNNFRTVPVRYGNMSRIVATVLNKRDSLSNQVLPMFSVSVDSIQPDPSRKRSHHHVDAVAYETVDGTKKVAERLVGPPLTLMTRLDIYASSTTQMFEILEQILLVFNPRVAFQTSNSVFNSDYITELALESIEDQVNYPMGQDSRTIMMSLTFSCPIRLRYPMDLDAPMVEIIKERIFDPDLPNDPLEESVIVDGSV